MAGRTLAGRRPLARGGLLLLLTASLAPAAPAQDGALCGECKTTGRIANPWLAAHAAAEKGSRYCSVALEGDKAGRDAAFLPCPRCKDRMVRKNFGGASGVILDVCRHDGIWLDHRELERVLAFVRAGGLVEARRREVKRLEDAAREAKSRRDAAGSAGGLGDWPSAGLELPVGACGASVFSILCDLLFSR